MSPDKQAMTAAVAGMDAAGLAFAAVSRALIAVAPALTAALTAINAGVLARDALVTAAFAGETGIDAKAVESYFEAVKVGDERIVIPGLKLWCSLKL